MSSISGFFRGNILIARVAKTTINILSFTSCFSKYNYGSQQEEKGTDEEF